MIIIMNTCVYISCIINATPASSIRVDDNCAQVASDSANYERPMCRSKHICRRECENDGRWHDMNGLYPDLANYERRILRSKHFVEGNMKTT